MAGAQAKGSKKESKEAKNGDGCGRTAVKGHRRKEGLEKKSEMREVER